MLSRVYTFAIEGLRSRRVTVEVDVRGGLPALTIVGLGDRAVREARERVKAAMLNSGFDFPASRVTVNLAPAYLRKVGAGFDLAIACGILVASEQLPAEPLEQHAIYGELSLAGVLRPTRGALAVAEGAAREGIGALIVPLELVREASLVDGIEVIGAGTLQAAAELLRGGERPPPEPAPPGRRRRPSTLDLADVRGQFSAVQALEIAAAGGHNLLLSGPPGTGKTMLARRLPTILPPLTRSEAIEVTRIHSVAGLNDGEGLAAERPFRAPHHTISASGMVGGGSVPRPGEATLAHNGVLFLDELSEFARPALEALRQPLEDGYVTIVRAQRLAIFPTQAMLVAATNPCICGFAGSDRCRCSEADHARHRRRLSGPLLDRIDLVVACERPSADDLARAGERTSAAVAGTVCAARARQQARLKGTPAGCNAQVDSGTLRRHSRLDTRAEELLAETYARGEISARAHQRAIRVAWTIADLEGSDRVMPVHVLGALALRQDLPVPTAIAA